MEELKIKKCFKCEQILSLDCFYQHKQMPDGHLNKCKECTKKDVKCNEQKLRNDPDWVMKERKRHRDKYYRLEYQGKWKPNKENKREICKRYSQKYPEKWMAKSYCEIYLTKRDGYHLHHWSYNQEDWLDIIELTIKDHRFLHRYMIYDQERFMYRDLNGTLIDSKDKCLKYFEECKTKYEY